MSDKGVFAVSRGVWDHPVLSRGNEPFGKREAWIWLVSEAAWKAKEIGRAGKVIRLERGELCHSVRFIADKWLWSKSRIDRFINVLENQDMIRAIDRDGVRIYKILNYNDYQVVGLPKRDADRDTDRDSSGTAAGQQRDKEEEIKHLNIEEVPEAKASGRENAPQIDSPPPCDAGKPSWWPKRDKWHRIIGDGEYLNKIAYDVGRAVVGKNYGGVVSELRKIYSGDMRAVADLLCQAHEKSKPMDYIGAVLRDGKDGKRVPSNHEYYPYDVYRH